MEVRYLEGVEVPQHGPDWETVDDRTIRKTTDNILELRV